MPTGLPAESHRPFPASGCGEGGKDGSSDGKSLWRQWARQQRQHSDSSESLRRNSQLIANQLYGLIMGGGGLPRYNHVLGFAPVKGEPDLWPLWIALSDQGVHIWLPKISVNGHMDFLPWQPGQPLVDNTYGIQEPLLDKEDERHEGFLSELSDKAVCIVPMLAGMMSGYRLGFGGGYYDRFLAKKPRLLSIGVVVDGCLVPSALAWRPQPYDQPVDVLVTERRVVSQAACSILSTQPRVVVV